LDRAGFNHRIRRRPGHKNAAYSIQYSRITAGGLREVINDR
jgi:hypothetical protein